MTRYLQGQRDGTEVELKISRGGLFIRRYLMSVFSVRNITCALLMFGSAVLAGCASQSANQTAATNRDSHTSAPTAALKEGEARLGVPKIIEEEHHALHEELEAAIKAGGKTGEAARGAARRRLPRRPARCARVRGRARTGRSGSCDHLLSVGLGRVRPVVIRRHRPRPPRRRRRASGRCRS